MNNKGFVEFDSWWLNSRLPSPVVTATQKPMSKKQRWMWKRNRYLKAITFAKMFGGRYETLASYSYNEENS